VRKHRSRGPLASILDAAGALERRLIANSFAIAQRAIAPFFYNISITT
jgi:hypothetical protein